ncbi:unnamed protein product [Trichogramma brassicae]|uniref:Uncharacterized protein n=1 Tax=Trichogramma brassicae TaxID=86971 RepID=A0A6H5IHG6_9HYME|nr:unnamed protein product [Trichogramma brassicae]
MYAEDVGPRGRLPAGEMACIPTCLSRPHSDGRNRPLSTRTTDGSQESVSNAAKKRIPKICSRKDLRPASSQWARPVAPRAGSTGKQWRVTATIGCSIRECDSASSPTAL